jgi:transposase
VTRRTRPYPTQLREQAVRMVNDVMCDHPSQWSAIQVVSLRLGISTETLRRWIRAAEDVDDGRHDRVREDQQAEIRRLRHEIDELRRANEVLRAAPQLFAQPLLRRRGNTS